MSPEPGGDGPDVSEERPESDRWIWTGAGRPPVPRALVEMMSRGWAPRADLPAEPHPALGNFAARRLALTQRFEGRTIVVPTGGPKVRSNDTDFRFRPGSDLFWLSGWMEPNAVLVLGPGERQVLFVERRSDRSGHSFFTDDRLGEFWVGPGARLEEIEQHLGITTAPLDDLPARFDQSTLLLRGLDAPLDGHVPAGDLDTELAATLSEMRLCKDAFEIAMLQQAVDTTVRAFEDVVRLLPDAVAHGERFVEGVFDARARLEGNGSGYTTIAAAGVHATVLHWMRNDGPVRAGDLLLVDGGVEGRQLYTSDVTRTIPVSGHFSSEQREVYEIVFDAQQAAMSAVRPGVPFMEPHRRAMAVLAEGLHRLGILRGDPEVAVRADRQLHRRWTMHGTSHMLGLDMHDCSSARHDHYHGELQAGYVLTVEPGLYFQPDDLLVPERYRGIGIRIEDDVLVTRDGCRNLSEALPRHPDAVEAWVTRLGQG